MSHLRPTAHAMPEDKRELAIDLLAPLVASAIDLRLQVKQAHWNTRGPNFSGLHKLFDKVASDVDSYVDMMAERIAQLGGDVLGCIDDVAEATKLESYETTVAPGAEHVTAIAERLAAFSWLVCKAANSTADLVTQNILIDVAQGADAWLWQIESHKEAR